MGDIWLPDKATSRYVIQTCLDLCERMWDDADGDDYGRLQVRKAACIVVAGYYAALRGEEIGKADFGAIKEHWNQSIKYSVPNVSLMLSRKFKVITGLKLCCEPLAAVTKDGVNLSLWFSRYMTSLDVARVTVGPLFATEGGKSMSIGELDILFHALLKEVQLKYPLVISPETDAEADYSVYRSLCCGATSEAQNAGISEEVINAHNRWGKVMRAKGLKPGMSMMENYTDAQISAPTLIRFSLELPC